MTAKTNALAALLAVLTLTAFAPAPLPRAKRERRGGEAISIETFQGHWRVTSMERTSRTGKHTPHNWQITHIRVRDDRWTFMANTTENTSYRLKIDGSKKPGLLDYYWDNANANRPNNQQPAMVGIIRRAGNRVEILYLPGTHQKPTAFDPPPEGWWLLKLQKEG